ncbi:MAG: hypothetical protein KAV87_00290 [Desulfobacteraceae bacterium]|nr:hypothetical protein [Desulfobacteraceae bacterium]
MPVRGKVIKLDNEKMRAVSQYILDAMNQAQDDGYTIDDVITAVAFCTGVSIARRGGILPLDLPLRDALPPLALGYNVTNKEMDRQ